MGAVGSACIPHAVPAAEWPEDPFEFVAVEEDPWRRVPLDWTTPGDEQLT